jgi:tRNA(Glu) U13 pseudouridine synthase TruD
MRYKVQPDDFIVEERIRLPRVSEGPFAIYRVRKRGVTTLSVQAQMAQALGVAQDERFPGRHKMTVAFTLPRGSYATLVLKVLGVKNPGTDRGDDTPAIISAIPPTALD